MSSYEFKVVLLGEGSVGKTSLALRYVSGVFNDSHQSTFQASFLRKQLYIDKDLIRLNLWDTAGQEKFHALGPIYYRKANGALLVYDVTNPDSFDKVKDWTKELNKIVGTDKIKLSIIGNKIDLLSPFEQKSPHTNPIIQEALRFTHDTLNAKHYLTSAKLNLGIGEQFINLSRRMIEQHNKNLQRRAEYSKSNPSYFPKSQTLSLTDDTRDGDHSTRRDSRLNGVAGGDEKARGSTCNC